MWKPSRLRHETSCCWCKTKCCSRRDNDFAAFFAQLAAHVWCCETAVGGDALSVLALLISSVRVRIKRRHFIIHLEFFKMGERQRRGLRGFQLFQQLKRQQRSSKQQCEKASLYDDNAFSRDSSP